MGSSTTLNRSRQVPAEETPAFGGIAERFRRAGDLDRAVALCRDGLKKFPDHLSARVTLGWALLDLGKYEDARVELEQALKRAPDNLAAIRGLAELHDRAEHTMLLPMDGPGQWPPDAESVDELEALANEAARAAAAEEAAAPSPAPAGPAASAVFAEPEFTAPASPPAVVESELEIETTHEAASRTEQAKSKKKSPKKAAPAEEPILIEQASAPPIVVARAQPPAPPPPAPPPPPPAPEQRAEPVASPVASPTPPAASDEVEELVRELAAADTTDPDADIVDLGLSDVPLSLDQMVQDLGPSSASAVEPAVEVVLDEPLGGIDVGQPAALESFLAEAFDSPVVDAANPSGERAPKDLSPTFATPIRPRRPAREETADADIDLDKLVAEVNALEAAPAEPAPLFGSVAVADAFVPSETSTTPPIVAKSEAPAPVSAPPLPEFLPPAPVTVVPPEPVVVVVPEPEPEDPKRPALVLTNPTPEDFPLPEAEGDLDGSTDAGISDVPNELPLLNALVADSLEIDVEAVAAVTAIEPEPTGPFLELTNPTIDDFPAPIDPECLDENPFGFGDGEAGMPLLTLLASLPEIEPEPVLIVPPAPGVRPGLLALERLLRKVESRRAGLMSQSTM